MTDLNEQLKKAITWDEDAKAAKRLVMEGAGDPNILGTAIQFKMNAVAKAMLERGISPLPDALIKVAYGSRDKSLAKALVAAGIDVNATDDFGKNALQIVIHNKKRDFAEALVVAGADVNKQTTGLPYNTALHLVCETSGGVMTDAEEANALWLVGLGADPNILNSNEYTPLHHAAQYARLPVVAALVEAGARTDLGHKEITPLVIAERRGDTDIISALRR